MSASSLRNRRAIGPNSPTSPQQKGLPNKCRQSSTPKTPGTTRKSVPYSEPKTCNLKRKSADHCSSEVSWPRDKQQEKKTLHESFSNLTPLGLPLKVKPAVRQSALTEHNGCHSFKSDVSLNPAGIHSILTDSHAMASKEESSDTTCAILVAVRVRPLSDKELDADDKKAVTVESNDIHVMTDGSNLQVFSFDCCFNCSDTDKLLIANQAILYKTLARPLLNRVLEGYNACLFAYGQTGSGKSYSIMGTPDDPGLLPRFCSELFEKVTPQATTKSVGIEISYFEIYNEKIHDLLGSSTEQGKKPTLRVREHPVLGPYVVDLSTFVVSCYEDLEGWLLLGNKRRATAATGMNDKSSRSHAVFTVVLSQSQTNENLEFGGKNCKSRVNLVDLAGSERNGGGGYPSFDRLKEGANINRSLLTLGKVICNLAESASSAGIRQRKVFVPYRESVLTWLLKDSLGGNSRTAMLATVSPASSHVDETLSTLRFAKQARNIVNKVFVNEDPKAKLIRELQEEIRRLQNKQSDANSLFPINTDDEINALKHKLHLTEAHLEEATRTWKYKLEQAEKQKAEENKLLEKFGVSCKLDENLPHLVNLNEDPLLSEVLVYILRKGDTHIGRKLEAATHEIQLQGSLIAENHCVISNSEYSVTIIPFPDASTFVNGNLINKQAVLQHGDRVVLGGDHYFRFNCVQKTEAPQTSSGTDFHFARHELLQIQELRLREEMQKERERNQEDMQKKIANMQDNAEQKLQYQRRQYEEHIFELRKALDAKQKEMAFLDTGSQNLEMQQSFDHWSPKHTDFVQELYSEMGEIDEGSFMDQNDLTGSLYELSLQIREANGYCTELGKDVVFSLHQDLSGTVVRVGVCVRNLRHGVHTFWDVNKFKNRINVLKEQAEERLSSGSDIFNTSDVWLESHDSPSRCSLNTNTTVHRRNSSSGQYHGNSATLSTGTCPKEQVSVQVTAHCREKLCDLVTNVLDCPPQSQGSVVDIIVRCCNSVKIGLDSMIQVPCIEKFKELWPLIVQLKSSLEQLFTACCVWMASNEKVDVDNMEHLKESVWDMLKELFCSTSSALQGIEADVVSLLQEYVDRSSEVLCQLCIVIGELALAQKSPMSIRRQLCEANNCSVVFAVVHGVSRHLERSLRNSEAFIEDKQLMINALMDDSFFAALKDRNCGQICQEILASVLTWLQKFTTVQTNTLLLTPLYEGHWPATCEPISYLYAKQVLELVELLDTRVEEITRQTENLVKSGSVNSKSFVTSGQGIVDIIKQLTKLEISNDVDECESILHEFLQALQSEELNKATDCVGVSVVKIQQLLSVNSLSDVSCTSTTSSWAANSASLDSEVSHSRGNSTTNEVNEDAYSVMCLPKCICSPCKLGGLRCPVHVKDISEPPKMVRFDLENSAMSASLFSSVSGSIEEEDSIDL